MFLSAQFMLLLSEKMTVTGIQPLNTDGYTPRRPPNFTRSGPLSRGTLQPCRYHQSHTYTLPNTSLTCRASTSKDRLCSRNPVACAEMGLISCHQSQFAWHANLLSVRSDKGVGWAICYCNRKWGGTVCLVLRSHAGDQILGFCQRIVLHESHGRTRHSADCRVRDTHGPINETTIRYIPAHVR